MMVCTGLMQLSVLLLRCVTRRRDRLCDRCLRSRARGFGVCASYCLIAWLVASSIGLQEAAEIELEVDDESHERYDRAREAPDGIPPGTHFYSNGSIKMHGPIEHRAVCTPNIEALLAQAERDANA